MTIGSKATMRRILIKNKGKKVFYNLLADSNLMLEAIMLDLRVKSVTSLPFQITSLRQNFNMVIKELELERDLKSDAYKLAKRRLDQKKIYNKKSLRFNEVK